MKRTCVRCRQTFELETGFHRKSRNADGFDVTCKWCCNSEIRRKRASRPRSRGPNAPTEYLTASQIQRHEAQRERDARAWANAVLETIRDEAGIPR